MIIDIIIFSAITLICAAAGSRMSGGRGKVSMESFVIHSCIGLLALSLTVLAAGILGCLYRWVFILLLLLAFIASYKEASAIIDWLILRSRMAGKIFPTLFERFLFSIFLIVGIASLFKALSPEIGNDALAYHLAHPKIFVETHRIAAIEYARESLWPYFMEMLFTLGILLHDQALAKLFHFESAVLLSLGIYAFCGRYFSRNKGILAAVIFFTTPAIFTQAGYAYIDITIALYAFMSFYLFLIWRGQGRSRDLILSGIFCGVCMSIKYLGSYVFICMIAVFVYHWLSERNKGMLKALLIFSVAAGAVAFVWYLRSFLITGNPFYPFFYQYFKNAWDNPISVACGTAKNLKNLILLPWNLTMRPLTFGGESIGIIYLMFLPFLLLWDGLKEFRARTMLLFAAVFTLLWFTTFQATRYLFVILPMLAILVGASVTDVSNKYRSKNIIIFILSLSLALNCAVSLYHAKDSIRVVLGLEPKESYLARKERSFSAYDYINKNTAPDSRILTTDPRIYYCDRKIVYSGYYLACKGIKDNTGIKELAAIAKKNNFTHLLLVVGKPFDKEDKNISSAPVTITHQNYFIENTSEDGRYILLRL